MSTQDKKCHCKQEYEVQKADIDAILDGNTCQRGELLPLLQRAQNSLGYIPQELIIRLAEELDMPIVDIYGVATFYNQFKFNKPGRHSIRVCTGTACHVKGSGLVLDEWEKELGVKPGETTADGGFDLDTVACVGCCGLAPVVLLDDCVVGMMRSADVEDSIRKLLFADEQETE